jgi:H+-transporting ATPase
MLGAMLMIQVFRKLTGEGKDLAKQIEVAILSTENKALLDDALDSPVEFIYSHGLTDSEAAELLRRWGRNELPEKVVPKWYIFLSQLWQPMPIMIWIAAIVEAAIQNYIDMAILLFIQLANATIGYYEISKAGDAVAALKKSLKPEATVKRNGEWKKIDAALVVPGTIAFHSCLS